MVDSSEWGEHHCDMEVLDINDIHAGRVLASPVVSSKGLIILDAGKELTQGHLDTLKQWGITSVTVLASRKADSPPSVDREESPNSFTTPPPVPDTPPPGLQTQDARPAASSVNINPPSTAQPDDFRQAVRESVADRFLFLDTSDAINTAIFEIAVKRQSRITLKRPGAVAPRGASAPAFQTQRPPKAQIKALLKAADHLGTLPLVFHRLVEIANEPKASADDIAKIIAVDPALTVRLLKLVNSSFYGFNSKVDTISRAVALVGTQQLVMLSIGATIIATFKDLPISLISMEGFWIHSICCGASARLFAKQMQLPQAESFFVAGLLHDIARLLIYTQLPTHALYLLTEAKRQQRLVHDLEEETLGFTHEQLGSELMHLWNCPPGLAQRILRHHQPVYESSSVEHAVLPAANMLAQALGYGSSGETRVYPISSLTWKKLGATPEILLAHCKNLDDDVRHLQTMFATALR